MVTKKGSVKLVQYRANHFAFRLSDFPAQNLWNISILHYINNTYKITHLHLTANVPRE